MEKLTEGTICGNVHHHTPAPSGYANWHDWAEQMNLDGYKQVRCPQCDRYEIWVKVEEQKNVGTQSSC